MEEAANNCDYPPRAAEAAEVVVAATVERAAAVHQRSLGLESRAGYCWIGRTDFATIPYFAVLCWRVRYEALCPRGRLEKENSTHL